MEVVFLFGAWIGTTDEKCDESLWKRKWPGWVACCWG